MNGDEIAKLVREIRRKRADRALERLGISREKAPLDDGRVIRRASGRVLRIR